MSGISAIAEPEEQDTEIEEVEDGSKAEDSVDLTYAINYSLTDDLIITDAELEEIRVNRAGVMAQVMGPIYPTPHVDLHPSCDLNHNLIVRPKGGLPGLVCLVWLGCQQCWPLWLHGRCFLGVCLVVLGHCVSCARARA